MSAATQKVALSRTTKKPGKAPPVRRGPALERLRAPQSGKVALQPALRVGAADDPLEREAERNAERITSMTAPELAAAPPARAGPAPGDDQPLASRSADGQPTLDQLDPNPQLPAEQQDVEVPATQDVAVDAFDNTDLKELETERPIDTGGDIAASRSGEQAVVGPEGGPAPEDVGEHVRKSGGSPLPADLRGFMEPRFGTDFSDVRIHVGPEDRRAARRIGARAFTLGRHIWFGEGETPANRKLLAHELTHVVQQTGGGPGEGGAAAPATREAIASRDAVLQREEEDAGWIAEKAEGYANDIPGYPLIKVLLGKSPITGKKVDRNATNLIGGFMSLIPGGNRLFEQLREANVIETAFEWVKEQLSSLDLTWARILRLVDEVMDLTLPTLGKVKRIFRPFFDDLFEFVARVGKKVLEFIIKGALKLAGPHADKVWAVIEKAGEAISLIFEDPIGFAKNLVRAIVDGFTRFKDNIWEHLKKGLLGWLFGALATAGLELPEKLDFKGIMSIVLQVIGLSYEKFRKLLIKKLGPKGERTVALIEKSVEIVRILIKEGILGIWQKILGMIESFKATVIDGIQNMVIETVIRAGVAWLAGLTNPIGGIIKIALSIYDMVLAFLDRLEEFAVIVNGVFSSIFKIAKGQVADAATFIEKVMATAIPVVISFLAALLGLNTIPKKLRDVLKRIQGPVETAMAKIVTFIVKKAKLIISKLVGKLNKKRKLPGTTFVVGKVTHRLYAEKKGSKVQLYVESEKETTDEATSELKSEGVNFSKKAEGDELKAINAFIKAFETETNKLEKDAAKIDTGSEKATQSGNVKKVGTGLKAAQPSLTGPGEKLAGQPHVDTGDPTSIIRFKNPISTFEGQSGLYGDLSKRKSDVAKDPTQPSPENVQLDHTPARASLAVIQKALLAKEADGTEKDSNKIYFSRVHGNKKLADDEKQAFVFGRLSNTEGLDRSNANFPAIAVAGPVNSELGGEIDAGHRKKISEIIQQRGLQIGELKAALNEHMIERGQETLKLYGEEAAQFEPDEAEKLIGNVQAGLKNVQNLAREELRLAGDRQKEPEKVGGEEIDLARETLIQGDPPTKDNPDFISDEGSAGPYHDLSGKKTAVGLLEADHSPMGADMQKAGTWTLGDVLANNDAIVAEIQRKAAISKLGDAETRKNARSAVAVAIRNTQLNLGIDNNRYSNSKGGAVVVARDVNQHKEMKEPTDNLLGSARSSAAAGFDDARKKQMAQKAADGGKPEEIAAGAVKAVNLSLIPLFYQMIEDRQNLAYRLYQDVELPNVIQANKGSKDKGRAAAVALARIAARVNSGSTKAALKANVKRWFPTQ